MQDPVPKSGEHHTDEEWDAIRETFSLLYIGQGRPLPEVRKLLAEWFGFYATIRQYKTRILKWGETKKAGKTPRAAHTSITGGKWRSAAQASQRGIIVPVHKPHRLVLAQSPSPPGHLKALHTASHGIGRFYSGALQAGEVDQALVRSQNQRWNIRQFYETALTTSTLASSSRWPQAQALYAQLLDHAGPLLEDRNPIVAICLLQICARFHQEGQGAVLNRFLAFVVALASARGLDAHPLRLLASGWLHGGEHSLDLITMGSQQAYDILRKELGPEHPQTLAASRALHTAHSARGDHVSALGVMKETARIEAKLKLADYMTIDAKMRMVYAMLSLNDLESASDTIESLEGSAQKISDAGKLSPEQLKRLTSLIRAGKGELLRRKLDPEAEEIFENLIKSVAKSDDPGELDHLIRFQKQLKLTTESLKTGVVKPFVIPC